MLKDCDWSQDRDYKTGSDNEPLQFYLDGLANSNEFNLLLGYFSSSAINLLSVGFATFISKGGRMRMVINHLLSSKDKEAIEKASQESFNKVFDLTDVVSLGRVLDEYDTHFFECLAYLIAQKRIEIKVIKPKNGKGIAHYKSGVFSDGENFVGYKASCNFTLYGLSENLEELEAFLSWENGRSNKLIKKQQKVIDDYFTEKDKDVEYVPVKDIEVVLKDRFGKKEISELLVQEEQLLKKKMSLISNPKLKKTINKLFKDIDLIRRTPKFPYPDGPRDYQNKAYLNWTNNNCQGLFAMATGTGKTITSLNCLLEEYKQSNYYRAIIVVPTVVLVSQWLKECEKFNFNKVFIVNSKTKWNNEISSLNTEYKLNKGISFIIIVTYASFVKDKFQDLLKDLPKDTLFIADEAHNIGASNVSKKIKDFELVKRIGLSATPERQYDEIGNNKINLFFKSSQGYTFSYSMKEAIENNVLCKYLYFPHIVHLTEEEQTDYIEISKALAKIYNSEPDSSFFDNPIVQMRLLERKRIIHKANNKLKIFNDILTKEFFSRGNLKYTLVYVPEGFINQDLDEEFGNICFNSDSYDETSDDIRMIDIYTRIVSAIDERMLVGQYTSKTNDRDLLLRQFEKGEIDVLTSMKCLDEGVDVPRAELAIFCASTGNPRQFVQRRGRILRNHKDKIRATIHDLVVVPIVDTTSETFEVERNMLKKELERVVNFSSLSNNKMDTFIELKEILEYYKLNLYQG
jgi:superfamily II DNA or RNA helicase